MIGPVGDDVSVSLKQADRLVRAFRPDLRALRVWSVAGAVSAEVTGIEVQRRDHRCKLVLRQYGTEMLEAVPSIADTEFRLLKLLSGAGLPVPRPCLADESGTIVQGPCVLMEFIDGDRVHQPADLPSFIRQLGAALAAVHGSGITRADVPFLRDAASEVPAEFEAGAETLDGIVPETDSRNALQACWPPPQVTVPVVLHGDYWPGNVLWRDGRLVGIIDWEEAAFGDPMADLANIRLEIVWHFGPAAMETLTSEYLALRPAAETATLPLWDLRAALRACRFPLETLPLPAEEIAVMRAAHREFAVTAMRQL